uniref:Aminotransferase-like plant mobile domain-containing protein n=1 Tax=Oryza punctata TaxID=4537 RepID=A0A0E0ML30_ORYPU
MVDGGDHAVGPRCGRRSKRRIPRDGDRDITDGALATSGGAGRLGGRKLPDSQSNHSSSLTSQNPPPTLVEESTAAIISVTGAAVVATATALPGCACAGPVLGDGVRVEFHGWPCSSALWRRWVERLRPRHEPRWREFGILDAVLATGECRVRRDDGLVLQLAAFWCTSSFVFPWGEATLTLEDAAVLGGLPLIGAPVTARLPGTLAGDVASLEAIRTMLHRSKSKNSTYSVWLHHFLDRPQHGEGGDGEDAEAAVLLEHCAFLATWLSLYVLPAPPLKAVRPQVFPIAARP